MAWLLAEVFIFSKYYSPTNFIPFVLKISNVFFAELRKGGLIFFWEGKYRNEGEPRLAN